MAINPIDAYARSITSGKRPAGTLHRLACQRYLDDRQAAKGKDYPYRFDLKKAKTACAFFEVLKHYKGEWAGTPIRLEPWQQFVVGNVFGWVSKSAGRRRYRQAYVEIPRKNGKSLMAAGIALYATFADGEPGAEGYVAATKRDQARIVFDDAKQLVTTSGLKDRIGVQVRNLHRMDTASKLEPLSADTDSMDGLNIHCAIVDEFHAHKDRGMIDVLETAMGARRQPLMFIITTAGADSLSPCADTHDYAEKILRGTISDDTLFAFIAHADESDDPFDETTWRKANPNYDVSVKPEDLKALAEKARHMPTALAAFKQKRLDLWIEAATPWLNVEVWNRAQSVEHPDLRGRRCYAGVDLSSKLDMTAVVLVFPPDEDRTWRLMPWFFVPRDTIRDLEKRYRAPLSVWVDRGHVIGCVGSRIDQREVAQVLIEAKGRYDLQRVGCDPYNLGNFDVELNEEFGTTEDPWVVQVPQNIAQLSENAKEFEAEVAIGHVDAAGHPVMAWNVSNAVVDIDNRGNIFPTKSPRKLRGRIDGLIGAIIGMKLAREDLEQEPEWRDIQVIPMWGDG